MSGDSELKTSFAQILGPCTDQLIDATQRLIDQEVAKYKAQINQDAAVAAKLVARGQEELRQEIEAFREKELEFRGREEAFEKEKANMSEGTQMRDVMQLNVGGMQMCAATRQTLCAIPNSMLSSKFSGRWDGQLNRDEDGRIFVDFSPDIFMPLLDWLRNKSIEDPSDPTPAPTLPSDKRGSYLQMCTYFGIPNPFRVLYKCIKEIFLTARVECGGTDTKTPKLLRRVEVGEIMELLEGPLELDECGVSRMRVRLEKDGVEGWITVKNAQCGVFCAQV